MQISNIKYPAIHAKLNGMYAQKLKKFQLEELIKQNSTRQAVALLKSFHSDFKDLEDTPQRTKIKILLDASLIQDIQKIVRLLNKQDKEIFLQFISIYEIKCIKSAFRKLSSNSTLHAQKEEVQNWTEKIFPNLIGLENVKELDTFLEILKKTKYAPIFAEYGDSINQVSLFQIENKLDKLYFENMMKIAKSYNSSLEDMIGKQIDLNNIVWIYRVRKHYGFSREQIKDILIFKNYKLKKAELEKLMDANDERELIKELKQTYYAKYIDFNELADLDEKIDQYLYKLYQKYFRGNILNISAIYAYIGMVEKENNDIMNIVEGIRYHLNKDEIRKKLIINQRKG